MSFPSTLTAALDGITEIIADHLNNLEAKVGVDNSAIAGSLDYKLRNVASVDPGHKHTAGAFTGGASGDVFFKDPADGLWKPVQPDTANLVARTGAQSIAGIKTFTAIPVLPASDPTTGNEATRKTYVDAQVALKVAKAGDTMSGPLAMGGNNITGVGTLVAATAQLTNPLAAIYGGTGLSSYTVGDLLYASAANALSKLADVAVGQVLVSGGIGVAPAWSDTPTLAGITCTGINPLTTAAESWIGPSIAAGINFKGGKQGIGTSDPNTSLDLRNPFGIFRGITGTGLIEEGWGSVDDDVLSFVLQIAAAEMYGAIFVAAGDDAYAVWQEFYKTRSADGDTHEIVHNEDELGIFNFYGDDGVGPTIGASATFAVIVDGVPGAGSIPARMSFYTAPGGGQLIAPEERLTIKASGNIGLWRSTFGSNAAKVLGLGSGTAPTTSPADVAQMWVADVGGAPGKAAIHIRNEDGGTGPIVYGNLPLSVSKGGTGDAIGPQYGEVWFYTASGDANTHVNIDTALLYHAIVLNIAEGLCLGFTSKDGQENAIASVAENSAGVSMKITTTGNHNLTAGECVTHTGLTTKTAYRGKYIVQSVVSPTVYVVLGTYTGTDTGFMKRGFSLTAGAGSAGVYRLSWNMTLDADENTTQIKVEVNRNVDDLDNIASEEHFVTKNLDANMSASGLVTIADGDFIWMSMANRTDGTDINIRHMNLNLVKV
jgi:hypothetical protein